MYKKWLTVGFKPVTSSFLTTVTPYIYILIIQKSNDSADKSARHGQNHENE